MTGEEIGRKLGSDESQTLIATWLLLGNKEYDTSKLIPKVKIPKYVADYIDKCKRTNDSIYESMVKSQYNKGNQKIYEWLMNNDSQLTDCDNQEAYAGAWVNGYEIEQE